MKDFDILMNMFFNLNVDFGFHDPGSGFAEALIHLYNFIGFLISLTLIIILYFMGLVLLRFNYNLNLKFVNYFYNLRIFSFGLNHFYSQHSDKFYLRIYDIGEFT
jgi:hypothetical protein